MSKDLRSHSRVILDGPDRAQARAYLKGIGFDDDALSRPIIGIANTWTETMPCNFHLRRLAVKVKEGVRAAGGSPMGSSMVPAEDGKKGKVAEECGRLVLEVLEQDRRPSSIITKRSLENAIAAGATSGGSRSTSRRGCARPAGRRWSSTPSRSRTASRWAPRG